MMVVEEVVICAWVSGVSCGFNFGEIGMQGLVKNRGFVNRVDLIFSVLVHGQKLVRVDVGIGRHSFQRCSIQFLVRSLLWSLVKLVRLIELVDECVELLAWVFVCWVLMMVMVVDVFWMINLMNEAFLWWVLGFGR
jgi:hypothetical protein